MIQKMKFDRYDQVGIGTDQRTCCREGARSSELKKEGVIVMLGNCHKLGFGKRGRAKLQGYCNSWGLVTKTDSPRGASCGHEIQWLL